MERFAPALRRVARELDLPRRARSTLLLEMAADLEAVYEHHRVRGVPEEEAVRRAEATVLASTEVIRRLGHLHRSPWPGWADEVAERLTGGLDLLLLVAGAVPALLLAGATAGWVLTAGGSPLVWLLLTIGAAMVIVAVAGVRRLRQGRGVGYGSGLLVLAALAAALGLLAGVVGLQDAVSTLPGAPSRAGQAGPGPMTQAAVAAVLARDAAALLVGLLLGLAGLVTWFVLLGQEARRADREVESLLGRSPGEDPAAAEYAPDTAPRAGRPGDHSGATKHSTPALPERSTDTIPLVRRRH